VKAMEVDEKPTEDYNDIGGLEKQVFYFRVYECWNLVSFLFSRWQYLEPVIGS
jgi:hypothetical protein